jgi:exodeoxyribonuclease VII large subunit
VTAAQHQVEVRIDRLHTRLQRAGSYEMLRARQRLSRLSAEGVLRSVRDALGQREQRLDELGYLAASTMQRSVRTSGERLLRLEARLRRQNVSLRLGEDTRRWEGFRIRLHAARLLAADHAGARADRAESRLQALSPLRVLERGYALIYTTDGKLLRSSTDVRTEDMIIAQLATGRVRARVTETE